MASTIEITQGDSEEAGLPQTITGDPSAVSFTQGSDQDQPLVIVTVLFASYKITSWTHDLVLRLLVVTHLIRNNMSCTIS